MPRTVEPVWATILKFPASTASTAPRPAAAVEASTVRFEFTPAWKPLITWSQRAANAAGAFTAITRSWPEGMTHAQCRRCPASHCTLTDNVCLVQTPGRVEHEDCSGFVLDLGERVR